MNCQPATRDRARRAERDLRELACVEHVDLLAPDEDPSNSWTLDIVAWSDSGRVPWQVADVCGTYRLDSRAAPQGSGFVQILAVA